MRDFAPFLPLLGSVFGLLCLMAAFWAGTRRRLVENLPISKSSGVFIGLVALNGRARSANPLTSYLAEEACVHYSWSVEEHWSRTVTETYTDSEGKTQTRTREESGWTTVASGSQRIPFYLEDDCGAILIRPDGAKIEPAKMFSETCARGAPLYYAKGPAGAIGNSDHRRRFSEQGIPLGTLLYVMGQARERADVIAAEIAQDEHAAMFLISTRSEEQVGAGLKWAQYLWGFFGLVLTLGGILWRDAVLGPPPETRIPLYVGVGVAYLAAALLAWVWMVYNSFVDVRQRVRAAWALIDIQLKRRHDLIPNLVQVASGCKDYERQLQTELAAMRSELLATPPGVQGPDYGAVGKVAAAIAERYPQLKADTTFTALQKNLIDTEQRIALARGYFNDIATHYNTRLAIMPEGLVAALGGMKPQTLMAANDFERAPVKVDLAVTAG